MRDVARALRGSGRNVVLATLVVATLVAATLAVQSVTADTAAGSASSRVGAPAHTSTTHASGILVTTRVPGACSPAKLVSARDLLEQELQARERRLGELVVIVDGADHLSDAHRATLTVDVNNEQTGIEALLHRASEATSCAQVRTDVRQMVVNFRVEVVMVPQVRLVVAADTETAISAQLAGVAPRLEQAISGARSRGRDTTAALASLDALDSQLTAAQRDSSGIAATALALTPSCYPGCKSTFSAERTSLRDGLAALRLAHGDLRSVLEDVR